MKKEKCGRSINLDLVNAIMKNKKQIIKKRFLAHTLHLCLICAYSLQPGFSPSLTLTHYLKIVELLKVHL